MMVQTLNSSQSAVAQEGRTQCTAEATRGQTKQSAPTPAETGEDRTGEKCIEKGGN